MDDEDVQELLARVERIAQCPVCLEVVRSPVVQCVNGHVTCGQCSDASSCYVCRQPYSDTSPRVLEKVLSVLPQQCPNEQCSVVTLLDRHAQYCIFRQINCRLNECRWTGTVQAWVYHANRTHSTTSYQLNVTECLQFRNFSGGWKSRCYYHLVGNQHFLSKVWKKGVHFYHSFRNVKYERSKDEYGVLVTYKCGRQVMYKTLIKVLPYENDESMENNAAVFPLEELNGLVDGNDNLSVFVQATNFST